MSSMAPLLPQLEQLVAEVKVINEKQDVLLERTSLLLTAGHVRSRAVNT